MNNKEIGAFGEAAAREYLENNDYDILEQNFSLKTGEIDIIAEKGGCTIFIEVKTPAIIFSASRRRRWTGASASI